MPRSRCHGIRARFRLDFELLETRTLLTGGIGGGVAGNNSGPVWTVLGDQDPALPGDTIVIRQSPQNDNIVQAVVNGKIASSRPVADVTELHIRAGAGDDTVT